MGSIGPSPRAVGATVLYLRTPRDSVPGRLGNLRNFEHEHLSTHIRDAREIESSLDVQGFKLVNEPSQLPESQHTDPDRVKAVIYPETEEIIRRATGASKVHAFSHLVRTHCWQDVQPLVDDPSLPDDHQINVVTPSRAAHVDHSREGSFEILRDNLPAEEVERVLKSGRRWAIINLWRPIKPVQRDPLCLCDFRSFEAEDLKTQTITLPKTEGSKFSDLSKGKSFHIYSATVNPKHEWYWCSDMQPEEAWLIKIFDSEAGKNGIADGTLHTSFQLPGTEELPARNSYEVRNLVFYD